MKNNMKFEKFKWHWVRLLQIDGVARMIDEAVCIDTDLVGEILIFCIPKGTVFINDRNVRSPK
jgi:hypothetical protein